MAGATATEPRARRARAPRKPRMPKPDGMSQEVYDLGLSIGNMAMAAAIIAVDEGRLPDDPDAINDFLVVSNDQATKALKRYVNLNKTIGKRLSDAYRDWQTHKKRSERLFTIVANGGQLPDSPNGTSAAG